MTPPSAAAVNYCRQLLPPPDVIGDLAPPRPPRSVAKVLRTGRLPYDFFRALSAWFRVTDADRGSLPTKLRKGGGIHNFLGCLTAEVAPVPGLAGLMLLGVERDGGAYILHSFFFVSVKPYNPDRRLFGCHGDLPSEGLPGITGIPVDSFAERRVVSAVLWEYDIVHMEGVSPSSWRTKSCKRVRGKA